MTWERRRTLHAVCAETTLLTRHIFGTALLVALVATCATLGIRTLVGLWLYPDQAALVRWSVAVTGSIITLAFVAAYLLVAVGRDESFGLRIRYPAMPVASAAVLFVFVTPLFELLADTLGTLAGLLTGLLLYVISRLTGL